MVLFPAPVYAKCAFTNPTDHSRKRSSGKTRRTNRRFFWTSSQLAYDEKTNDLNVTVASEATDLNEEARSGHLFDDDFVGSTEVMDVRATGVIYLDNMNIDVITVATVEAVKIGLDDDQE